MLVQAISEHSLGSSAAQASIPCSNRVPQQRKGCLSMDHTIPSLPLTGGEENADGTPQEVQLQERDLGKRYGWKVQESLAENIISTWI